MGSNRLQPLSSHPRPRLFLTFFHQLPLSLRPQLSYHHYPLSSFSTTPPPFQSNPSPLQSILSHHLPPSPPSSDLPLPASIVDHLKSVVDPFELLAAELSHIKHNVKALVGSSHHTLDTIAKYYLSAAHHGKHLRPLVVLLVAQASSALPQSPHPSSPLSTLHPSSIDQPLSPAAILSDTNPTTPTLSTSRPPCAILPTQRRLAEIAEMIHVASLLHDDVLDAAPSRRGTASSPRVFGNKLSVLAGDFLLARASVALSRLGNLEVVELIASVVANLVEGELMQLGPSGSQRPADGSPTRFDEGMFELYERKNYLKTASLIAKTARAAVLLSSKAHASSLVEASYRFGKHLGLAFQIVDDILDYTSTEESLGKPGSGSDLKAGLVTGPGLFAWQKFGDQFGVLVDRKFGEQGDMELAQMMVQRSNGIKRSYELARAHLKICYQELAHDGFAVGDARDGLHRLCELVLERSH